MEAITLVKHKQVRTWSVGGQGRQLLFWTYVCVNLIHHTWTTHAHMRGGMTIYLIAFARICGSYTHTSWAVTIMMCKRKSDEKRDGRTYNCRAPPNTQHGEQGATVSSPRRAFHSANQTHVSLGLFICVCVCGTYTYIHTYINASVCWYIARPHMSTCTQYAYMKICVDVCMYLLTGTNFHLQNWLWQQDQATPDCTIFLHTHKCVTVRIFENKFTRKILKHQINWVSV